MDTQGAQNIIATLKSYSSTATETLGILSQYDYREEANQWDIDTHPKLLEPEHPTLRGLYYRLAHHITTIPGYQTDIDRDNQISRANIAAFANYLEVTNDTLTAAAFNRIAIEPMQNIAAAFKELNLQTEARILNNIYEFAHGIRKWHKAAKNNPGTPISITLELNYDQVTPEEQSADAGFKIFTDIFKPTCNYTTSDKRALYKALEAIYDTNDEKVADKIVMAFILLFRTKPIYKKPFSDCKIGECKRKTFASLGKTGASVKSYTENSLTKAPKLTDETVKQAENIIRTALGKTKQTL